MKQFIIIMLILMASFGFANITPTTTEPTTIFGGEVKDYNFTITNDFSYDVNCSLDFNLWNESGNFEGMNVSIYPSTNFPILAYEKQVLTIRLKPVTNISPELYGFSLKATYYLSDVQTPIRTNNVYVGGGGRTSTKIIYQDKNIEVIKEIPKETIKEVVKEIVKEVPTEKIVYKDSNTNDSNQYIKPSQVDPIAWLLMGIIAVGGIGLIIFLTFISPKK